MQHVTITAVSLFVFFLGGGGGGGLLLCNSGVCTCKDPVDSQRPVSMDGALSTLYTKTNSSWVLLQLHCHYFTCLIH